MGNNGRRKGRRWPGKPTLTGVTSRVRTLERRVTKLEVLTEKYTGNEGASTLLVGWSEIAKFIRRSESTAWCWARGGMPVARIGRHVISDKELLRRWIVVVGREKRRLRENR